MQRAGSNKKKTLVRNMIATSVSVSWVYPLASHGALQHVLGKTSGRSYKAAPRQLLQIAISSPEPQRAHPHVPKDQEADIHQSQTHKKVAQSWILV